MARRNHISPTCLRVFSCATILTGTTPHHAFADSAADQSSAERQDERLSFIKENDYFASHDDRHYTLGLRVTYLFDTNAQDDAKPCDYIRYGLPLFESRAYKRKYEWTVIGQNLYTPQNLQVSQQLTKNRAYGAWLYTGLSLFCRNITQRVITRWKVLKYKVP